MAPCCRFVAIIGILSLATTTTLLGQNCETQPICLDEWTENLTIVDGNCESVIKSTSCSPISWFRVCTLDVAVLVDPGFGGCQNISVSLKTGSTSVGVPFSFQTGDGKCFFGVNNVSAFEGFLASRQWELTVCNGNSVFNVTLENWALIIQRCGVAGKACCPSPANGATGVFVNADLDWGGVVGAASYDVYFGTNPTPGGSEFKGNTGASGWNPPGDLIQNTTYYWRIDTMDRCQFIEGDIWSFTTTCSAPGQPSSPSPSNGASSVSTSANLDWANVSGATSYDVYFGTDSTPDSTEFKGNTGSSSWNLVGTLSQGTTYYWRIDPKNSCGTTTGPVWSFTTTVPLETGACCVNGNTCITNVTQANCNGVWQGANSTSCSNCPQPPETGACCVNGNTCITNVTQANCNGDWQGANSTSCSNCPPTPPTGACCVNGNTCNTGVTESACANQGGDWQGANSTSCSNCPPPPETGACCVNGNTCITNVTQANCNGVWQGANSTSCSNCPATGACCLTPTSCQQMSESQCIQQGGTWRGANVSCNAISCETCPNGNCDQGETPCNCPQDCGEPPSSETNCSDGIDNDCDGLIDSLDEDDCISPPDCNPANPDPATDEPDHDGVCCVPGNCLDNCPNDFNPDQADSDGDGIGDACDIDDLCENCLWCVCGTCIIPAMGLCTAWLCGVKLRYRRRRRASP